MRAEALGPALTVISEKKSRPALTTEQTEVKHRELSCECPDKGERLALASFSGYLPEEEKAREHEPDACPGDYNLQLYQRDGRDLWLCSCCWLPTDVRLSRSAARGQS